MEVEVYVGGRREGTMPYASLPAFRLFCRQNGFRIKWDAKNRRIDLDAGLRGKTCVLEKKSSQTPLAEEILNKLEKFLANAGIEVRQREAQANLSPGKDLAIRFGARATRALVKPKLVLTQREQGSRKTLIASIQQEMRQAGIVCAVKEGKTARSVPPHLDVELLLPEGTEPKLRRAIGEKVAFCLSSGILRYFQDRMNPSPLSWLPPQMLNAFVRSFLAEPADGKEPAGLRAQPETDEGSAQNGPISGPAEQQGEASAGKIVLFKQPLTAPPAREQRLEAEVFFDYTVIRSEIERKPFLIIGNVTVKNTGTEWLNNPVVCLRADPADSIQLGGQILPPKLVETMAVQGAEGAKGWKYLEDDWASQARQRGEYWICPIQPVQIAPQQKESFQNFQISVLKPENSSTVTIEGFVFFREQGLRFASNNRISLSC